MKSTIRLANVLSFTSILAACGGAGDPGPDGNGRLEQSPAQHADGP